MTDLELRLINSLENALHYLSQRVLTKPEYIELMSDLRDTLRYVLNLQSGCPLGRHRNMDDCFCRKLQPKTGTKTDIASTEKRAQEGTLRRRPPPRRKG